ncbi:Gfo/Idh/MocA family oxidoreductase [Microbacterium sp. X-17]|uniref:Gfo/Idh/MocA family protein n=1 Tax=Microbacterium sp. X-17 TaxID=3144404 RepID=UPI0031F50E9D
MGQRVRVAIVGLGFGAEFIPIYQRHPDAELVAICRRDRGGVDEVGDAFGIEKRYTSYEEVLADPDVDAIHINTPIPEHAQQSIAALRAGKHVACTVPMATSLEDCKAIIDAARTAGKNYMMMETVVYSREFLYAQELARSGALGRIQFLRGSHQQEMGGWPGYWEGLPPMHYATHAVSPLLTLAGHSAAAVSCVGSGRIDEALIGRYGSPFAIESAHLRLHDSDLAAEVTRSLFNTAREYRESFDVYGSLKSFEWEQTQDAGFVVFTGETPERVEIPDFADRLPEEIRSFTTHGVYDEENAHLSFVQGSGHGGSHPHLVHEFVSSIVEGRHAAIDEVTAANWTGVGIAAHESAMQQGAWVELPAYTLRHRGLAVQQRGR